MKTIKLTSSMADIAARSPFEALGPESRYVVAADLRMGDGGKKDELAIAKKALFEILGRWYLPRGYTLILNGDVEDLRNFWLKDILAAWPEMFALFDAFAEAGRLRKILGERDLALLRLRSYPYELLHGLRLDSEGNSILALHGHQASPPYVGREYLSDFIQSWLNTSNRAKAKDLDKEGRERLLAERRLHRSASRLGIMAIEGHTRRPLFESLTKRDSVRSEIERLLRDGAPGGEGTTLDALIAVYRRESRKSPSPRRLSAAPGGEEGGTESPCLFCPGRLVGARGLRLLEIDGDSIRLARWSRAKAEKTALRSAGGLSSPDPSPQRLEGSSFLRFELRSASIRSLFDRIGPYASDKHKDSKGGDR
jgi:hypothetical protein